MPKKLTDLQRDALSEMANIGAGNASTVISKIVGREVKLTVSALEAISVTQIPRFFKASQEVVITIYASISGDIQGNVMLFMHKESALSLADLLQGMENGANKRLSVEVQNVLRKISLSLFRCYLNAISGLLNVKYQLNELRLISTLGETLLDLVLLGVGEKPKHLVLLKTDLDAGKNINGSVIFFLPIESVEYLLTQTMLACAKS